MILRQVAHGSLAADSSLGIVSPMRRCGIITIVALHRLGYRRGAAWSRGVVVVGLRQAAVRLAFQARP